MKMVLICLLLCSCGPNVPKSLLIPQLQISKPEAPNKVDTSKDPTPCGFGFNVQMSLKKIVETAALMTEKCNLTEAEILQQAQQVFN